VRQFHILIGPAQYIALAAGFPQLFIRQAFFLCLFQRFFFNQQPLALVTPARPAELHDHSPQLAMLLGPAG
jgi:hypothetical protein